MAGVMFRGRSLRSRRSRGRQENLEENVTLDYKKAPADNVQEALINIVQSSGISKAKKLGYLNAFVRLCYRLGTNADLGYSVEEILCCLRVCLLHEAKEMRAACLRAIRYLCHDKVAVEALIRLHIDCLIARSLDICIDNEIERLHAMRLIRKIMLVSPDLFPSCLLNAMVSIANDGAHERDKMLRTCLASLCELAFYCPRKVSECGGISSILRNILDCHHLPRVNESLLVTILYMLNHPRTRYLIKPDIDLEQLLAPFTDCHFKYSAETGEHSLGEDRENRFSASKMAIATIIKSWPGMIRLCKPDGSGLQSLLGVLYLPNMETRKEIMDILYDIFRLPVPDWVADFSTALLSVDPSVQRDSWRLVEGFVAEEGNSILPHTSNTRPNLVENHMALILSAFVSAGLLEALIEVISSSEDQVSIRATILLGELLHMANTILPFECSHHSHCLPSLMAVATSFDIASLERNRASIAVTCLNRLHAIKKRGPVPSSLYLDQILQQCSSVKDNSQRPLRITRDKLLQCLAKDGDHDLISQAIRDSMVGQSKDNKSWDWDLIAAILKWPDENLKKLDDQNNQRFVRRLLYFFKPTNKLFSKIELTREDCGKLSLAGLYFIDFLLECEETESQRLIDEWLNDIAGCLAEIRAQRAPHDALFAPSVLVHTVSQDYFLFIGHFSASQKGEKMLDKSGIYQYLLDLMTITSHDTYIKLIVSSLDYSRDGTARVILSKGLTATSESARLYTASFMRVLLRANVPFFSNWGMELLVMQLYDQSKAVAMEALSVISEACEKEVNLHTLVNMRPAVLHLGYKGAMLLARFLSIPAGFKYYCDANYVIPELEKWHKTFNVKYVQIVEERLNEALTTYEKTYDGSYTRRSAKRQPRKDVYVPVHLYGQLVQHKAGFQLLGKQDYLQEYFDCIKFQDVKTDDQVLKLKAALWAVGHVGTSVWGLSVLQEESMIPEIIKLAEESGVFSVRGTAYYVLGLIASTHKGADILSDFGWESVRHKRGDAWPVISEKDMIEDGSTGLSPSVSSVSVATSSKLDGGPASPGITFGADYSRNRLGSDSDSAQPRSVSPQASYLTDSGEFRIRSRSGTGSSPPVIFRLDGSPLHDSVLLEERTEREIETKVDIHRKAHEQRVSTEEDTTSREKNSTRDEIQRSQSDPQRSSVNGTDESASPVCKVRSQSGPNGQDSANPQNTSNNLDMKICDGVSYKQGSVHVEKSYNQDSYRTSSKSRSDSLNTDTTTSGVSSYESGAHATVEHVPLSPIPSASSMTTDVSRNLMQVNGERQVHPSDTVRKLLNFKRIPTLQRRYSNPGMGHLSPTHSLDGKRPLSENITVKYTSTRDAQGYATLRELQRQRGMSVDTDPDISISSVFEEPHMFKTQSLDFRLGKPSHMKTMSLSSLQDVEVGGLPANRTSFDSLPRTASRQNLRHKNTASGLIGRAEYLGLCLPVDVTMIFQEMDEEDPRSWEPIPVAVEPPTVKVDNVEKRARSISQLTEDSGLPHHTEDNCLACSRINKQREGDASSRANVAESDDSDDAFVSGKSNSLPRNLIVTPSVSEGPSPNLPTIGGRGMKSRDSSYSDMTTAMQGSITSTTSAESSSKGLMSENSEVGRTLIRKEVLRFIISLSSSVGVKSSEQGLLMLRQKFSKAFQDVCLYSEVCYLLSNYNYRLNSRRFIQELFQDIPYEKVLEEPKVILGLDKQQAVDSQDTVKEVDLRLDHLNETSA